jgi:hypothetical protein
MNMRKTAYLLIVVFALLAAPAFAQGPFNDVPTDHWAYDAVNQLQKDGIVIGYPDGTFGGRRAMSRYEFATAIARLLPLISEADLSNYVTKPELQQAIAGIKTTEAQDLSNLATKADVDAIKKLVDEFRDELAALGVDVDALKRDVAALCARVDALEAEQNRVRFTGDVNVFAIATSSKTGVAIDQDQRVLGVGNDNTLIRNIGVIKDFDLNVTGRVSKSTTAVATINYGDYLNYLGYVDSYVDGMRDTAPGDSFFPYYLYINTGLSKGALTVGRFPIQWTPYTLKKVDVDTYTSILKTDDGNYPVDGIKLAYNFGGVDLTLFAAKNDENYYLFNGLSGQIGAMNTHDLGGEAVGGLDAEITQSAGVRATFGTPWKGILGLTYYQAWSKDLWGDLEDYDQARVYGADLNVPFGNFGFVGSWTKSDTLANDQVAGVKDLTKDNQAWDTKLTGSFGKLGVGAGYKHIGRNFAAAGAWDKIGRWTNPTDVKGPYVDISLPIARKLKVALNGEFLKMIDDVSGASDFGFRNDKITKAEAGVQWGMSAANSLVLGYEWIRYNPDAPGIDNGTESYINLGWAHQFSDNAGLRLGYQFVKWDGGNDSILYGPDYRGGVAVAQFGVSF